MKFAFSIYDFEGNETMDAFFMGDCLRALNLNPTLAVLEKVGFLEFFNFTFMIKNRSERVISVNNLEYKCYI